MLRVEREILETKPTAAIPAMMRLIFRLVGEAFGDFVTGEVTVRCCQCS